MSDHGDAPKIVFPCDYPMKVIASYREDLVEQVRTALAAHDVDLQPEHLELLPSRNGRFLSVRVRVQARSEAHVHAMFVSLKQISGVQMVL